MKVFASLLLLPAVVLAQSPQVPHKMDFAGMVLTIRDDARQEIQADVDALTKSPTYFNPKAERARMYFPLIEQVLREERVPDDFKYLVLQESALIPDAVSSSNAVGFWQFKDFTAIEMGLRIDNDVDERMNVVSSTRAAARYLKKNNFYFNNWVYALQAYQMGAGGVMKEVKNPQSGAREMDITGKTYWYVKKFLAHKVAFENATRERGNSTPLTTLTVDSKRSVADLARELKMDEKDLLSYNKWIRGRTLTASAECPVVIPSDGKNHQVVALASTPALAVALVTPVDRVIMINGLRAIRARKGERATTLAGEASIRLKQFLRWNDLSIGDKIIPDVFYYVEKKNRDAAAPNHITSEGENLWSISQHYGIRLNLLQRYNDEVADPVGDLGQGMLVWLSNPPHDAPTLDEMAVVGVEEDRVFNWSAEPEAKRGGEEQPVKVSGLLVIESRKDPEDTEPTAAMQVPAPSEEVITNTREVSSSDHVVTKGETLYSISRQYGLPVADLAQWNDMTLSTPLQPGQTLKITDDDGEQPAASGTIFHQVTASDTMYSVARRYGVTIKDLMEWNGKTDFDLSVGEKLRIQP